MVCLSNNTLLDSFTSAYNTINQLLKKTLKITSPGDTCQSNGHNRKYLGKNFQVFPEVGILDDKPAKLCAIEMRQTAKPAVQCDFMRRDHITPGVTQF